MKIIQTNSFLKIAQQRDMRFRASIYVDLFIKNIGQEKEQAREEALKQAQGISDNIPNSYVGGAAYNPFGSLASLDREI